MRSHESSRRDEVTEFSEAALDPVVFIPPRDFKRVHATSGRCSLPGLKQAPISLGDAEIHLPTTPETRSLMSELE